MEKNIDFGEVEERMLHHLRNCYPITSEMKERDEEPIWDCIGGMMLCYDEGNEVIRTGDWQFWHDLPIEVRQYVIQKFAERNGQ